MAPLSPRDHELMRLALNEARAAALRGEVPVGALLVDAQGLVLAVAGNDCVAASDPVGHAEIRVLRRAGTLVGNYRLPGATMYVTLESCSMCAGAMVHARIGRVVFGALDPKAGALVSRYRIGGDGLLNHAFTVDGPLMAEDCGAVLREFFQKRR